MIIHIDPNRVRTPAGGTTSRNTDRRREQPQEQPQPVIVPSKADVNYVPGPESLKTMIGSAVAALTKGVRWDRGSIVNLLV